ncbi:unnamed protein product, partial [Didymodactylos carnosus]
ANIHAKRYRTNVKLRRAQSPSFDKQYRQKVAARQARLRSKKKEGNIPLEITRTKSTLRRKEGKKRRKEHINHLNTTIDHLQQTIENQRNLIKKLKRLNTNPPTSKKIKKDKVCEENNQNQLDVIEEASKTPMKNVSQILMNHVSPLARERATRRIISDKDSFPRGTITKIRKEAGINLSNKYTAKKINDSELRTSIIEFLTRDDNSKVCPDKKNVKNNVATRFRLHHLSILHQRFITETGIDIHYSTFTRYVPNNIIKPRVQDWGTCLCVLCINPEMKLQKIIQLKSTI